MPGLWACWGHARGKQAANPCSSPFLSLSLERNYLKKKKREAGPEGRAGPTAIFQALLHSRAGWKDLEKCSPQPAGNIHAYPLAAKETIPWTLVAVTCRCAQAGFVWSSSVLRSRPQRSPAPRVCPQLPFRAPVSVLAPTVWGRRRHCAIWPAGGGEGGATASWAAPSTGGGLVKTHN